MPEPDTLNAWMEFLERWGALGCMALFLVYQTWQNEQLKKDNINARKDVLDIATKFATVAEGNRITLDAARGALERFMDRTNRA